MNSLAMMAFMAAGSQGGGLNPSMLQALVKMEEDEQRKRNALLLGVGQNVASGYRFLKGTPKVVDAAGKELPPEEPRYAGILLKYKVEEDTKYEALQNMINGVLQTYVHYQGDSSSGALAMLATGMNNSGAGNRPTAGSARFGG